MVVGDDAQSIYAFRNTNRENLIRFHEKFGNVVDVKLEHNFRSTPELVEFSNFINDLNTVKIEKTIISGKSPSGIFPQLVKFTDKETEYQYIADKIADLVEKKNVRNSGIAVIARTKFELFELEKLLIERKVPYVVDIPEPIIKHPKIKMAEHLLVFMEDGETTQGIFEYLTMAGKLKDKGKDEILDMIESYKEKLGKMSDADRLDEFYKMMDKVSDEVVDAFFYTLKEKNRTFSDVVRYVKKFIRYEDKRSIEKSGDKYNAITLTTAHTSKGKEFETVFVTMNKYIPVNNSTPTIEEERRTFYVSITRAKKNLFLTSNWESGTTIFEKECVESKKCLIDIIPKP